MRQCNRCLNILQKSKKENFYNLNIKQVSDNKLFWKNIKPFYSGQEPTSSKSTLVEGNGITSNEEKIANIVDDYFINITRTLNLKKHLAVIQVTVIQVTVIQVNLAVILALK